MKGKKEMKIKASFSRQPFPKLREKKEFAIDINPLN